MPTPPSGRLRNATIERGLMLLLAAYVSGLFYVGLTPFSFFPRNRVEPLTQHPGLEFDAIGIATSRGELRGAEQFPDGALSIHLRVEPDDEPSTGLGTILSIEDDDRLPPLIVAQWKTWLVVRVRDPDRAGRGYWEISAPGFRRGRTYFVSITSAPARGTTIYVDGVPAGDTWRRSIIAGSEPFAGRLLLGCLGNGSGGWRGKLTGLAIAGTALEPTEIAAHYARVRARDFSSLRDTRQLVALYDFAGLGGNAETRSAGPELLGTIANRVADSVLGEIEIPMIFAPLRPEVFMAPRLQDIKASWFLKDVLRNIVGFIPLGLIFASLLLRWGVRGGYPIALRAAVLGGVLSLGIESAQIALPMRASSLSDLFLNTLGAAIGAALCRGFRRSPSTGDAR